MGRLVKRAAIAVLILLAGGLIGFRCGVHFAERLGPPNSPKQYARILDHLSSKLRLKPDQRARVADILETNRKTMTQLHDEVHPKFEAIRNATDDDIRKVLDPDQQQKFDRMRAEWNERRNKREAEAEK